MQVAAPSAMCDSSQGVPVGKRKEDRMASEANKPEKNDNRVKEFNEAYQEFVMLQSLDLFGCASFGNVT